MKVYGAVTVPPEQLKILTDLGACTFGLKLSAKMLMISSDGDECEKKQMVDKCCNQCYSIFAQPKFCTYHTLNLLTNSF